MPEGSVVDEGSDQVEDHIEVDVLAQIASGVCSLERFPHRRPRRIEQGRHEIRPQFAVTGAIGEERTDDIGADTPKGRDEDLEAFVEITQGAARIRGPRRAEPPRAARTRRWRLGQRR